MTVDSRPGSTATVLSPSAFLGLGPGVSHLAAGGEAPPVRTAIDAYGRFLEQKSRGMAGRAAFITEADAVKPRLALLMGLPVSAAERIAFLGSAAEGINRFADGLSWNPGDEVVAFADEYPNALVPWLARAELGVRLVPADPEIPPEVAIRSVLTDRTRVICVSHTSYLHGRLLPLDRMRSLADSCGALLVVDASQSLGAVAVDANLCDVLVSCCYKFLLGVHGLGVYYCSERALEGTQSMMVGWHSIVWPSVAGRAYSFDLQGDASRFELGNPPFPAVLALSEGLKLLESVPVARMEAHVLDLAELLRARLRSLGLPLWDGPDGTMYGANIVFKSPCADEVVRALALRGVHAWSGDGRVRFSVHGYNSADDVERAAQAVESLDLDGCPNE